MREQKMETKGGGRLRRRTRWFPGWSVRGTANRMPPASSGPKRERPLLSGAPAGTVPGGGRAAIGWLIADAIPHPHR